MLLAIKLKVLPRQRDQGRAITVTHSQSKLDSGRHRRRYHDSPHVSCCHSKSGLLPLIPTSGVLPRYCCSCSVLPRYCCSAGLFLFCSREHGIHASLWCAADCRSRVRRRAGVRPAIAVQSTSAPPTRAASLSDQFKGSVRAPTRDTEVLLHENSTAIQRDARVCRWPPAERQRRPPR